MEYRTLGENGLRVSALGFGCGSVGGLMVRGDHQTQVAAVVQAMEAGITYFDTAQAYGDGESETNLGRVLQEIQPNAAGSDDIVVGTKVRLTPAQMDQIETAILAAAEVSLQRLQVDRLDLFQLHNRIADQRHAQQDQVGLDDLDVVAQAFEKLRAQGKIRHWGITGLGESAALHRAIEQGNMQSVQACYNLLNPSGAWPMTDDFPFQDYRQLIRRAAEQGKGVIAIRILAAGALSGHAQRHPIAAQSVAPISTNAEFAGDVALSQRFAFLVSAGWADTLAEAAIRFAISQPDVSTALIGLASLEQLTDAIAAAKKGPLPAEALERLPQVWAGLAA